MQSDSVDTPCIEWDGLLHKSGYGKAFLNGTYVGAHRSAWEVYYGPIPDGLVVMHRCDNPPCVRIDHLKLGTRADNMADMAHKGRSGRGKWTHCKNGHALPRRDEVAGSRYCRICKSARTMERRRAARVN